MLRRFILPFALLVVFSRPAVAAEPVPDDASDARVRAVGKAHFELGSAYFHDGKFREAIAAFEEAWRLARRPHILYNLALCYERLYEPEKVAEYLRQYLKLELAADEREAVSKWLERTEAAMAARKPAAPPPSRAPLPERPAPPEPAAPRVGVSPPPPQTAESPGRLRLIGVIGAGSVAIVGIGLGTGFGLYAKSKNDASQSHCSTQRLCDPRGVQLRKDAIVAADVSTVSFIVGATAAATGLVLWLWPSHGHTDGPRVALTPVMGKDGGSIVVRGQW